MQIGVTGLLAILVFYQVSDSKVKCFSYLWYDFRTMCTYQYLLATDNIATVFPITI